LNAVVFDRIGLRNVSLEIAGSHEIQRSDLAFWQCPDLIRAISSTRGIPTPRVKAERLATNRIGKIMGAIKPAHYCA